MAQPDEEAWIEELYPAEPGAFFAPGWRECLHELFLVRGPVEMGEVESLARSVTEARAQRACDLVAADALATLGETIEISTVNDEWGVRVAVDGQVVSGVPLHSIGEVELVVEVADAAQEEIMDDRRVWPECPHHNAGLHPELREGKGHLELPCWRSPGRTRRPPRPGQDLRGGSPAARPQVSTLLSAWYSTPDSEHQTMVGCGRFVCVSACKPLSTVG